ncbi:MAG: helix-turn-helix domain-containing protein [Roseomonas sp.]|nr:helix-turn-helix domain-containing protein [Roseomonas sp.]
MPNVLTPREAAAFLHPSERSLYELAQTQRPPAAQIGSKWLFPRRQLERWLAAPAEMPEAEPRLDPPPILAGSHAPLLDWAVRRHCCGAPTPRLPRCAGRDEFAARAARLTGYDIAEHGAPAFGF